MWSTIGANASQPDIGRADTPSPQTPGNASQQNGTADEKKKPTREIDTSAQKPSHGDRSGASGQW